MRAVFAAWIVLTVLMAGSASARPAPRITGDARVDRLLAAMTLDEKRRLLHDSREDPATYQGQAGYIAGVPRLGIPGLRLADGPPGVLTRRPSQAETATMGVAATFDVRLARQNGVVIGREARALGIDVALQPYVNIDRDPTFKRAYNTFGEDPLLTSLIGAAEVEGIQSQHVMAVAKHFISFDTAATDVWIDDQTLHEVYLPPFEAAVRAGVAGVMCSYNHIDGAYACGNSETLTSILRGELGFRGFVTSDWGATHSALFLNAGLDVEMIDGPDSAGSQEPAFLGAEAASAGAVGEVQGDLYGGQIPEEAAPAPADIDDHGAKVEPKTLSAALTDGSVSAAAVTRAAGHVLIAMDRAGLLAGGRERAHARRLIQANARIIERTAEEAAVLLKNDGGVLPLKASDLDSVVLIGPTARQVDAIGIGGERSLGLTERQIGPLAALRIIGRTDRVRFAVADDMTATTIPAALLSHDGAPGLQRVSGGLGRIDPVLDFTVKGGAALPADTTAVWSGVLTVPEAGTYWLCLQALGVDARLIVDGRMVGVTGAYAGDVHGDVLQPNQDDVLPTTDGLDNVRRAVALTAGPHALEVRIAPDTSHAEAQVRLAWYTPEQRRRDHAAAIEAARQAKIAVVFAWSRRAPAFALGVDQDRLIEEVAAVNPNTVVVLNTSQPVAAPWASHVKAILEMWWPGDEGGWATAKLLLGRRNPSGRLPVTWGRSLEDYPATDPRHPERSGEGVGGETHFTEGLDVGYRDFDRRVTRPLFPFGHGLSYTTFVYSRLKVVRASDGGLRLVMKVRNSGRIDGAETPQAYLGAPANAPAGVRFPIRKLVAFDRIVLRAGQTKTVRLDVPLRQLQSWSSSTHGWVTLAGERKVEVGSSSGDTRLVASTLGPRRTRPRLGGDVTKAARKPRDVSGVLSPYAFERVPFMSSSPEDHDPLRRKMLLGAAVAGAAMGAASAASAQSRTDTEPRELDGQAMPEPGPDKTAGPVRPGRGSQLTGKVAVVTGAARGIGRAIAVEFAANGADVVALDICGPVSTASNAKPATPADLDETVRQIRAYGRKGEAVRADIRDINALRRVADQVERDHGKIDIVVADAAIQRWVPLLEMEDADWRDVIDNNLNGTANTIRAFAPKMVARKHGRIIVLSSMQGLHGTKDASSYSASKWGIIGLMKSAAMELGQYNITVNALLPGLVDTALTRYYKRFSETIGETGRVAPEKPSPQETWDIRAPTIPLKVGWLQPDDISPAAVFLASDAAAMVTGAEYQVTGGDSAKDV